MPPDKARDWLTLEMTTTHTVPQNVVFTYPSSRAEIKPYFTATVVLPERSHLALHFLPSVQSTHALYWNLMFITRFACSDKICFRCAEALHVGHACMGILNCWHLLVWNYTDQLERARGASLVGRFARSDRVFFRYWAVVCFIDPQYDATRANEGIGWQAQSPWREGKINGGGPGSGWS
jgi:hypothetical protein